MGTAMPLIGLRQNGVLRQLSATPLPRGVLAASQVALRLTLALAQIVILVLLGRFALGVALARGRCRGWPCSCCPHWGRWS
jgi:ABC-2 type transport system permease protein